METISTLSALLESSLLNTLNEWRSMLKNLDGSLRGIGSGTHIKIPMDAGYVNFYRSQNSYEITVWMKYMIQDNLKIVLEHSNNTKSDKL